MKIGLEIHVALPTKSKLFCSCAADADDTNSSICPICMGFPGSKPMLNVYAVETALSIVHALHCEIRDSMSFVRKVYFYPDLPKSYQITQLDGSIGGKGYFALDSKNIIIRRVQLEEDPSKIVREDTQTLLDFNRCGVPLVEIVTEPDITSEEELREFLYKLRSMLYYLDVDIDREIKADLNISLAESRVEVKNVTGIKSLIEAMRYEVKRQARLIERGENIAVETRGFNEKRKITESSREKETDEEYGYMYDPDLATYSILKIDYKKTTYANEIAKEYADKYGATAKTISELIMFDRRALALIDSAKEKYPMQAIIHGIERIKKYGKDDISPDKFDRMLKLITADVLINKRVMEDVYLGKDVAASTKKLGGKELEDVIRRFAENNMDALKSYRKNKKVFNYFVGHIAEQYNLHPKDVSALLGKIMDSLR